MPRKLGITYLNRSGSGTAEEYEVVAGAKIEDLCNVVGIIADDHTLRVRSKNGKSVPANFQTVLKDGDRVSAVPKKVAGAVA